MQQPDGYIQPGKVCRLRKSLYGLKQSPRCRNKAFSEYMESVEFKQSAADPCVYVRIADAIIVAVYVDDLILIAKTTEEVQEIKTSLATRFKRLIHTNAL